MKKIIYGAFALATLLFAGSCQREQLEPAAGSGQVTFTVEAPATLQTKAIADGLNVDQLIYEVWITGDVKNQQDLGAGAVRLYQAETTMAIDPADGKNKASLTLDLVNDQNFTVLFWAQKSGIGVYNTENLTAVTYTNLEAEAYAANDNRLDAFYSRAFVIDGVTSTPTVTLRRPFAQVNLCTTPASLVPGDYTIALSESKMRFDAVPTVFNLATSEATNYVAMEFAYNAVPSGDDETIRVGDKNYYYAGMNYVFAGANLVLEYDIATKLNGSVDANINNTIQNVPIKENHRTNIIGNLLTSKVDYEIVVDANWADNGASMEVVGEGIVKNINGDYEISNVRGFAYMVNNLWVDDQGVANSATFYVHPGEYDFEGIELNSVNVTSGKLMVYNQVPVVTRSASDGAVVIKGLKKPLINTVSAGATVLFSKIIIDEFEGDATAALVKENNGKVILSGCEINDENAETVLVGGNAPEIVEGDEEEGEGGVNPEIVYTAEQLAAAFKNENVAAIALGADIAVEAPVVLPENRELSLDLRGRELTIAGSEENVSTTYAINNHGTLTIKDSYGIGEVSARGIYNGYVAEGDPIPSAKLIIAGGTFNAMGTNGGAAVYNYGQVEIKGGKFASNGGYGLNNQAGATMTLNNADVRGGIYNCGTLEVKNSKVYQHLSGKHAIYNWTGSVTIVSGEFDSESGNELIFADGESASVTINGGEFRKTAKSWLYAAATNKNISFVINGGTHYGYVNEPEKTVDTIRPYGDPIVVKGGSFNFDPTNWCDNDSKVVKNQETALWNVVGKNYVAQVGAVKYESLKEAVTNVEDGGTITLVADEIFTEANRCDNSGYWDGLAYSGDKSFTIDLGGHTIKQNGSLNDYLIWIKNDGAKANTITLKNGTMDAGTTAYSAFATASSNAQKITVNLENINLINNISNGAVVKARGGAELNVKAGTVITGKDSYVGIEAVGNNTVVNVYEGAEIYQNGTTSYLGAIIGASYNATLNINGGKGKSAKCGIIVMSTGATINVSGGEWTANGDGTVAAGNQGVLVSQNNRDESGWACKSILNVTGGTFRGGYNCYGMGSGVEADDAQINIKGGNFNADPKSYVVAGYEATENAGIYTVGKPKALQEFEAALANGGNVTLNKDVTLLEPLVVEKNVNLDLNGKTITAPSTSAFEVKAGGELTVKNGKVVAYESTVRAIGGKAIVESGEYTSTGTALDSPATYRYSLDCREGGELIINGGTFKSNNGMINVGSTVTINGGKFENIVEKAMTRHFAYVSAPLTINDGEFYGKANAGAGGCFFCGAAETGVIEVNGGKFTSLWTSGSVNRIFEVYFGGTIDVTGGMFNTNGGITSFVTENTDEATKAAYPYIAK